MDLGAALADQDVPRRGELAVRTLGAETLSRPFLVEPIPFLCAKYCKLNLSICYTSMVCIFIFCGYACAVASR